jgi:hypothetical protein
MKIHLVGSELFHEYRRTDRQDEANELLCYTECMYIILFYQSIDSAYSDVQVCINFPIIRELPQNSRRPWGREPSSILRAHRYPYQVPQ